MNFLRLFLIFLSKIVLTQGGKTEIELEEVNCGNVRVELVFVMDASSSISGEDFILEKNFMVDISGSFDVGQDKTRIGLVMFADEAKVLFGFKVNNSTKDVQNAITGMTQMNGITALGAGIKLAGEGVLKEARSGISKFMIVITDGQNNRWPAPKLVTPPLKKDGVTILVVGVGPSVDVEELKGISSSNSFINASGFNQLSSFAENIRNDLCKVKVKHQLNTCEAEGDISFIIDKSNQTHLLKQTELLARLLKRLEISSKKQRVALVVDEQDIAVPLDKFNNADEYSSYLTTTKLSVESKAKSGLAVSGAILTENRNEVAKLAVLIRMHDSSDHDGDLKQAMDLRNLGINVLTIGLGSDINEKRLSEISSTKQAIFPKTLIFDESYITEISEHICLNLKKMYSECVDKRVDLFFVLDSSESIGSDNWLKQLRFVARIVNMLDISNTTMRIGVVYFNSEALLGFKLGTFDNKKENVEALMKIQYTPGATATGSALKLAQQQISTGKRKDAATVIILVTDGKSNIGIKPETVALEIKSEGTHIISVGITDKISKDQLKELSSTSEVYKISSFESLEGYSVEAITKEACQAIKTEPNFCSPSKNVTRIEL